MAKPHVLVVGAGAFGGWTALHLLRLGARVTLCDAWGPANPRASSGDDTRIIRATYPDAIYVDLTVRALPQWKELEHRSGQLLFRPTGALWLASAEDDTWERQAVARLREAGVRHTELTPAEAARRYPQFDFTGTPWVLEEPEAGYLRARAGCAVVVGTFLAEGGTYREGLVRPTDDLAREGVRLPDGSRLTADGYVFACGPWLPQLFPDLLEAVIHPTRQEVFYFGMPSRDEFRDGALPVWLDRAPGIWYSIPSGGRGIKMATDVRGEPFDPTRGDRTPTAQGLAAARRKLAERLPALADAPLIEARVCQYEQTPDSHFVVDRLPGVPNAWVAGGGSGHGYKHGPAIGQLIAETVLERREPEPQFLLRRFATR